MKKIFNIKNLIAASCTAIMVAASFTDLTANYTKAEENQAITDSDFLKANGKDLRNQKGEGDIIYLHGTNAGGLLLQELWMCPTSYSNSDYIVTCEMDIYTTLTARFGNDTMRELIKIFQDNYWTETDFDNCKNLGMNCIRLPFWYMNLVDFDGNLLENAFEKIDWFVEEAGKRGMYVILDMHGAPGSQSGSDHSGVDGHDYKKDASEFFFGENALKNQELYYDLWEKIALHYKDNPIVAGYDLLNEPYCTYRYNSGLSDNELHTLLWDIYDKAYQTIRKVDPEHMIIMEATWDPVDLPNPDTYGWTNVMYEYHNYLYDDYDNANGGQISNMKRKISSIEKADYNVPSYMGEFSYMNNPKAWSEGVKLLTDSNLHWTTWTYKVTGTNNNWGLYNQNIPSADVARDSLEDIKEKWSRVGESTPNQPLLDAISMYFYDYNEISNKYNLKNAVLPDGDYYISTVDTREYLSVADSDSQVVTARSIDEPRMSEVFTLVNNTDGTFSLKSKTNGKFLCTNINDNSNLTASSSNVMSWEKFEIVKIDDEYYGLNSTANNYFVNVDYTADKILTAKDVFIEDEKDMFIIKAVADSEYPNPTDNSSSADWKGKLPILIVTLLLALYVLLTYLRRQRNKR